MQHKHPVTQYLLTLLVARLVQRQVSIVQELFGEVFALELLVQRSFVACQEAGMRKRLAQATRWVELRRGLGVTSGLD